jgi:hypothetical protein
MSQAAQPMHQSQPTMGNHQLVIVSQLLRTITSIQHLDELLSWLGHIFVQRLELEVVQFWTQRVYASGQTTLELHTTVCRNSALSRQVVINAQIAEVVERILNERHGVQPQPSDSIFSPQAAHLLTRNKLNYWASYYLDSSARLPPLNGLTATETSPTPLHMLITIFNNHLPGPRLLPTLGNIMEQAITHAYNHNLLYPPGQPPKQLSPSLTTPAVIRTTYTLMDLIPQKSLQEGSKPDHSTDPARLIQNRQARRLYLAVDGRHNLTDLSLITQLNSNALATALRLLLTEGHIQLRDPNGRTVDNTRVLAAL